MLTFEPEHRARKETADGGVHPVVFLAQVGGGVLSEFVGTSHCSCTPIPGQYSFIQPHNTTSFHLIRSIDRTPKPSNASSQLMIMCIRTKRSNRPPSPPKNPHHAHMLPGQRILDRRHEQPCRPCDGCTGDRRT